VLKKEGTHPAKAFRPTCDLDKPLSALRSNARILTNRLLRTSREPSRPHICLTGSSPRPQLVSVRGRASQPLVPHRLCEVLVEMCTYPQGVSWKLCQSSIVIKIIIQSEVGSEILQHSILSADPLQSSQFSFIKVRMMTSRQWSPQYAILSLVGPSVCKQVSDCSTHPKPQPLRNALSRRLSHLIDLDLHSKLNQPSLT
jgi:hypothetical protein